MSVMDWVGTVAMIWLAVSILIAAGWALAGKRIFRKPPRPEVRVPHYDFEHHVCIKCEKAGREGWRD